MKTIGTAMGIGILLTSCGVSQQSSSPLRLQGKIVGQEVVVSAKTQGKVEWVGAYAGDRINPGQILLRFDDAPLQEKYSAFQQQVAMAQQEAMQSRAQQQTLRRQLQQALLVSQSTPGNLGGESLDPLGAQLQSQLRDGQTELKLAQNNRDRIIPLVQAGALPRNQLEEAEVRVQRAKGFIQQTMATIETAQGQSRVTSLNAPPNKPQSSADIQKAMELAQANEKTALQKIVALRKQVQSLQQQMTGLALPSPFAGRVLQQMVETGSTIKSGQPLLKLVKTDTLLWQGTTSTDQAIAIGQSARITLPGHPQGGVKATVMDVQSAMPASQKQVTMKLEEDDLGLARPGVAVEAEIDRQSQ